MVQNAPPLPLLSFTPLLLKCQCELVLRLDRRALPQAIFFESLLLTYPCELVLRLLTGELYAKLAFFVKVYSVIGPCRPLCVARKETTQIKTHEIFSSSKTGGSFLSWYLTG